jgi:hypothetical protein
MRVLPFGFTTIAIWTGCPQYRQVRVSRARSSARAATLVLDTFFLPAMVFASPLLHKWFIF